MAFHVGQKVTMRASRPWLHVYGPRYGGGDPQFGEVYTVSWVYDGPPYAALIFAELSDVRAWDASRFRPVVSKSTEAGMKQLRSLLTDAPEKVEA